MSKDDLTPGDLQKILEHIDENSKKQSLDTALLFFAASITILFTLVPRFLSDWENPYLVLPALFIGWFLPVYIGYIRGSLVMDSIKERVRGWIYLIAGTGIYVFWTILWNSEMTDGGWFLATIVISFILFSIMAIIIAGRIHKLFDQEPSFRTWETYGTTVYSATYMYVFFGSLLWRIENPEYLYPIGVIGGAIGMSFGFFFAIYWEIKSRQI